MTLGKRSDPVGDKNNVSDSEYDLTKQEKNLPIDSESSIHVSSDEESADSVPSQSQESKQD